MPRQLSKTITTRKLRHLKPPPRLQLDQKSSFAIYDPPRLFTGISNTHPNNEENSPFDELSFLSASVNRAMAFSSLLDMTTFGRSERNWEIWKRTQ